VPRADHGGKRTPRASASEPASAPPADFHQALTALRHAQKTSKGAPAYSRFVNRRLGRLFAAAAYTVSMTPDQVTAVSAAFTFTGIATIATVSPSPASSAAVCVLLVVGYALDSADGQLARLRGGGSIAGEWLDHVVDAIKIATLHVAVLVSWYRFSDESGAALLIPLAYQAVASVQFFVVILNDRIRRAQRGSSAMILAGEGSSSALYALAVIPTDDGLLFLTLSLMFVHAAFQWVYGALMAANLGFLLLALVKWNREMRGYDAGRL
jgi:phosphatidylglycerophosphate synthase